MKGNCFPSKYSYSRQKLMRHREKGFCSLFSSGSFSYRPVTIWTEHEADHRLVLRLLKNLQFPVLFHGLVLGNKSNFTVYFILFYFKLKVSLCDETFRSMFRFTNKILSRSIK
jgi:hypothetical protein